MRRESTKPVEIRAYKSVLILVLVEYAPRACRGRAKRDPQKVLILVLVEYAPRDIVIEAKYTASDRLNPCFSGICAARA